MNLFFPGNPCVCKCGASAANFADAVDRLLIFFLDFLRPHPHIITGRPLRQSEIYQPACVKRNMAIVEPEFPGFFRLQDWMSGTQFKVFTIPLWWGQEQLSTYVKLGWVITLQSCVPTTSPNLILSLTGRELHTLTLRPCRHLGSVRLYSSVAGEKGKISLDTH